MWGNTFQPTTNNCFVWKRYSSNIDNNHREHAGKHVGENNFKHIGEQKVNTGETHAHH